MSENQNLQIIPQYKVAGGRFRIDLVVILPNGSKIAVECDGDRWHGQEEYVRDMERQRMLERSGWIFVRIRASQFYCNRTISIQPFWDLLEILS